MILTRQKNIPWTWIYLVTTIGGIAAFVESVNAVALAFTLRKFTADPALIVFLGSINIAFNFLVAPYASWKSDRIWTSIGRRKPFMIAGFCLLIPALIATPLAPNIWLCAIAVIIWQGAMDLGYTAVWGPLLYEIVPSHQRGRMVVIKRVMVMAARLSFNWVLIGQFDSIYHLNLGLGALSITGEQVIYFTAATLVLLALLNVTFNVRELPPAHPPEKARFALGVYLKDVFGDQQFRLLYLLLFCNVAVMVSLAQLEPLLITEQFGYTKAALGQIKVIILVVDVVLVLPLVALIADRFDRFRIFQIGLIASTVASLAFWCYVKFIAVNQIPTLFEYSVYALVNSFVDACALLALEPLFFDYVPRNRMGAMNSGFLFVKGILSVLVVNGLGLWVKAFSSFRGEAGGNDYLSGYLYMSVIGTLGVMAALYFDRQRRRGKLIAYGLMEEEQSPDAKGTPR